MKMNEIERETITVLEYSEPCVGLASEAKEVLGYSVLSQAISEPTEHTALEIALASCGIEVLNAEDVATYQRELLIERTSAMLQEWLKNPTGTFIGPSWDKTKIEQYREPIPEFVLNKAIQIKKAMPEVRIYIQHLSEHPDPFLVVATKHKNYEILDEQELWIEVWEEPKFEGRLR
jgi:hypothetical protein